MLSRRRERSRLRHSGGEMSAIEAGEAGGGGMLSFALLSCTVSYM